MGALCTPAELSRRGLLKAGGALLVGFAIAGKAAAQFGPPPGPDREQIDSWIIIHADTTATILIGFVELGQGCTTSLPQVAAEELDLGMDQIKTVAHETEVTPFQGGTYSSSAIANGRPQVQRAAAEARLELLRRAAAHLDAAVSALTVQRGTVSVVGEPTRQVTYGELLGDRPFSLSMTGEATTKNPSQYRIVGQRVKRGDLAPKVLGEFAYVQHKRLPGMLHARIIRPAGQGAFGAPPRIVSVDENGVLDNPGVRALVREGDFLAVVAEREWDAVKAARQVRVQWDTPAVLPDSTALYARMRESVRETIVVLEEGEAVGAVHQASFTAETPYQAHATMAPNCAVAEVSGGKARVWASSQDIYSLRGSLANVLGLPVEDVTVQYAEGSGTYGHSLYDDVAMGAALLSQRVGVPVRLQYSRADEHGWDTFGPAHIGAVTIACDGEGRLTDYSYDGWQHSWAFVETNDQLARGTSARGWPMGPSRSVNPAVCGGMYALPHRRLTDHVLAAEEWPRSAWLRSPLDLSFAFVSEQAVDELAREAGHDPVTFRRFNIADERWLGVLDAAVAAAGWDGVSQPSAQGDKLRGLGVGLGTHLRGWGGAVAEVEVESTTGQVRITHIWGALDAGCTVNPDIVEAQITGQLVQTVSRMLYEEVKFGPQGVTTLDWASYPVARFSDTPKITPVIVQRIEQPSSGAGEEVMAAAAAAIANAFYAATGKRMATFPFTPERVLSTLTAS
jgi:CO/xanthine dehydrogenase Mo-binding subunit